MTATSTAPARPSRTPTGKQVGVTTSRLAPPPSSLGSVHAAIRRTAAVAALCGTLSSALPSPALAASREGPAPAAPAVSRIADGAAPAVRDSRLPPVTDMVAGAVARVQPVRTGAPGTAPDMILASGASDYCETGSAGRKHHSARAAHELEMRQYVQEHNAQIRSQRASAVKGAVMTVGAAVLAGIAGKGFGHRFGASRGGSGHNFTPIAVAAAVGPGLYKMAKAGDFGRSGFRPGRIIERTDQPLVEAPACEPKTPRRAAGSHRTEPVQQPQADTHGHDRNDPRPNRVADSNEIPLQQAHARHDGRKATPLQEALERHRRQRQVTRTNPGTSETRSRTTADVHQDPKSMSPMGNGGRAESAVPPRPPTPAGGYAAAQDHGRTAERQTR